MTPLLKAVSMLVLLAVATQAAEVSPVQKVVELLEGLKAKCVADITAEEKEIEEYNEYCDEEASNKAYALKTAKREQDDLEASIQDGEATMSSLSEQISELGSAIAAKEQEVVEAKGVRDEEHATFLATEKDLLTTIDEMSRAVVSIKSEMSFLQGASKVKPSKKQLKLMAETFEKIVDATWVDTGSKRKLKAFLQQKDQADELSIASFRSQEKQPQASVEAYSDHSGGIVQTVVDMKEKAEASLSDARKKEMKSAHANKMLTMNLNDETDLLKKKLSTAQSERAAGAEQQAKAKGELSQVLKSAQADKEFATALAMECQEKNAAWTERKADSAAEQAAIDKAKEILVTGVKAAMLQFSSKMTAKGSDDVIGESEAMNAKRRANLNKLLKGMAKQYNSFALMEVATSAAQDPFAKVKGLIEDMITKLLNEANEEADHKNFCDEELAKSTKTKEEKMMGMDKFQARMDKAATTKAELQESIRQLQSEIQAMDAATSDATKLRAAENAEYLQAKSDYSQSAEAVEKAMSVLKSYYESGAALIQVDQKTKGNGDTASSILSILEVSLEDFTRLLAETETAESTAVKAFEKLTEDNAVSKAAKGSEISGKQSEIKSLSVALMHYKEDHGTVAKELDAVMDYLEKLKPQCTTKVMSYEERKARREAEVEGLKEALAILDGESV